MKRLLFIVFGLLFLVPQTSSAQNLDNCLNRPEYPSWCDEAIRDADPVYLFNYGMNLGNRNLFVSSRMICASGQRGFSDGTEECIRQAKAGNSVAQHYLSISYLNGAGVLQDYDAAYMWSNIAASKGHSPAAEVREYAASKMSPEQRAAAGERSQRCVESQYQDCEKEAMSWIQKMKKKW